MSLLAGLILAAGKGTRMKSDLPKGLFRVCGVPMVELIGRAMKSTGVERPVVVVGHQGERMIEELGESYGYVWQREQLGTGHAAMMAAETFAGVEGTLLLVPGDVPLMTEQALRDLVATHEAAKASCTVATVRLQDPTGYGRIVRDPHGKVSEVVEEKDATPRQKGIQEVNTGLYCFDIRALFEALPRLSNANAQAEYYLTDVIKMMHDGGQTVETHCFADADMLRGVNDRWQLMEASQVYRMRTLKAFALSGVTILDPHTTYIDVDVEIGADTIIHPNTTITVGSRIGAGCEIGPSTIIDKSTVGDRTSVNMSRVNEASIGADTKIGPFAHIRPASQIGNKVKIGNFVETKKSNLDDGASVSHLSYIGDASVGSGSNIGAGTITCNYDGFAKYRTEIGANAFVGSNSTLVAPVTLGDSAFVAAGSVVTKDVPGDALAVGRARQENKEGWVQSWRKRKASERGTS